MNSSYRFIEHRVIALSNNVEYQLTDSWPFVQKQALSWRSRTITDLPHFRLQELSIDNNQHPSMDGKTNT